MSAPVSDPTRRLSLSEPDPRWPARYAAESARLRAALGDSRLGHIGSTAVPGLLARPVIDMVAEVASPTDVVPALMALGYVRSEEESDPADTVLERREEEGPTYRLQLVSEAEAVTAAVLLRDHLREHPGIAARYARLKRELAGDPEAYAACKAAFIAQTTERAALGRRFPIAVVPYDPAWPQRYAEEAARLRRDLGRKVLLRVEHFGSTAVPGLAAKPVIDVLGEVPSFEVAQQVLAPKLARRGYLSSWQPEPHPGHLALWLGYEPEADQKYHLHVAPAGHPLFDRLLFRDYLCAHPEAAQEYARLKHDLAARYRHDREEYTEAKADFVRAVTERAREAP